MSDIILRDHQVLAAEALREGLRNGHRAQVLCAPTGSGKTVQAAHMLQQVQKKGVGGAMMLVDRVSLVSQTSKVLWNYGITHGVAQGQNTFGRREPIQVGSAQTIEKRGYWPDLKLLIVDECHVQRKKVIEFIQNSKIPVIGLSATPFSKGLGDIYTNVVNVTTTDKLIEQGFLAPLEVYAAKEIDMTGAKVIAGEWSEKDIETRGRAILGDIVTEWESKTKLHFGGPVKTIGFSASVAHGAEMCRQFQAAGYDFRQISYKDKDDDHRAKLIESFRRGEIMGLISCEALCRGFDVPDILCLIAARPYRKSFSSHIQMIGRAMRSAPGKKYALLLDHTGNYLGFYSRMLDFFANGVNNLDTSSLNSEVREEPSTPEKKELVCSCGYVLKPHMEECPACGKVRVKRNTIEIRPGEMVKVGATPKHELGEWLRDKDQVWRELCLIASERKSAQGEGGIALAHKFATAQYRAIYGEWPLWGAEFSPAEDAPVALRKMVTHNLISYVKSKTMTVKS